MSKANASYGHFVLSMLRVEQLEAQLRRNGIEPETAKDMPWSPKLAMRVEDFELSARTRNCLGNTGIEFIYQLVQMTEREVQRIKNLGSVSMSELKELLDDLGLSFGMNLDGYPKP